MRRLSSLLVIAFAMSLGLSACDEAEEVDEVEVEENGEVEEDD